VNVLDYKSFKKNPEFNEA